MRITTVLAIGTTALLIGCGSDASAQTEEQVIGGFVSAMNGGDREGALDLMADDVESHDEGPLVDDAARRAYLAALPECEVELASVEPIEDDLLVTVRFGERDGETCPGWQAGDTTRWVMRVVDGKITLVP